LCTSADDLNPARFSWPLILFVVCWGWAVCRIDCLSLVACPFLTRPLYCCTTPKPPFLLFLQRSSTSMAGRYADNFPSGLCRITLNLFFLLLSTSLDQSPLFCNVSCRIVSCLRFRGLSCPITIPLCTTPCAATVLFFHLHPYVLLLPLPSSHHPSITGYDYEYYLMLFSFFPFL
jgi:hypothetical protein